MLFLIRLSPEITTKSSSVRRFFLRRLIFNIKEALKEEKIKFKLNSEWSRIWIESKDVKIFDILPHIFGISSFSLVYKKTFKSLSELVNHAYKLFNKEIKGKTFAVRVKRVGKHKFTSLEVEQKIGAKLGKISKVDLTSPDIEINLEIRENKAYFFKKKIKGEGGFPLGVGGKALTLISGGFDSALASYFVLRKGIKVYFLFFNFGGLPHLQGVKKVVAFLVKKFVYGYKPYLVVIDFREILKEILNKTNPHLGGVILKRIMFKLASKVQKEISAQSIVTGESLGQVSSQTLTNLEIISKATKSFILRPLLSFSKEEIIRKAKEIGTYKLSSKIKEFCAIVSQKPTAEAKLEEVIKEEKKISKQVINKAFRNKEIIKYEELIKFIPLKIPNLQIDKVPPKAELIDIRSEANFKKGHLPKAKNIPFLNILTNPFQFSSKKIYVLYCEKGNDSLKAAQFLYQKGIKAYSLKGGIKSVKRKTAK